MCEALPQSQATKSDNVNDNSHWEDLGLCSFGINMSAFYDIIGKDKKDQQKDRNNSTGDRVFALHTANTGLLSGTANGPQSTTGYGGTPERQKVLIPVRKKLEFKVVGLG